MRFNVIGISYSIFPSYISKKWKRIFQYIYIHTRGYKCIRRRKSISATWNSLFLTFLIVYTKIYIYIYIKGNRSIDNSIQLRFQIIIMYTKPSSPFSSFNRQRPWPRPRSSRQRATIKRDTAMGRNLYIDASNCLRSSLLIFSNARQYRVT